MRQAGASPFVVQWFLDTRLSAAIGGPARRPSLQITHFRASGMCFGLRAFAGTPHSLQAATQTARRVGQKTKGKKNSRAQSKAAPAREEEELA